MENQSFSEIYAPPIPYTPTPIYIPVKPGQINHYTNLYAPHWNDILAVSLASEGDLYDTLGRNVSAQQRRQDLFPWFILVRSSHHSSHHED